MFTVVPFRIPAVPTSAAPALPTRRSRDTTAASRITLLMNLPPSRGALPILLTSYNSVARPVYRTKKKMIR
jgi:hypothetical protein